MAIRTELKNKKVIIRIDEKFDRWSSKSFQKAYREKPSSSVFVVDFRKVDLLDSAGLGLLVMLREYAGGDDSRISLINCNETIHRVLRLSHYHQLFDVV